MSRPHSRRILYAQYTNPASYPPLEHGSQLLARAGWQVLFLGTSVPGVESMRLPAHSSIQLRLTHRARPGWRQKLHYGWFMLWVIGWVLRWRPAWLYASDPLASPVALLLSYLPGLRVAYHEHDSPDGEGETAPQSRFMRLVLVARRRLAKRAALVVLPNARRAARLSATSAAPRAALTVWNCPTRDEVAPPRAPHVGGVMRLLYHGSLVPARLPLTILDALALLPDEVRLRVIGYETMGHQGYIAEFQARAAALGLAERLEVRGSVPTRRELLEQAQECDVGLALMPAGGADWNEQTMSGASNKPFDYLACGLALLVSELPDWTALYVAAGYALACHPHDPDSLAAALRWFLAHPAETRAMGEAGRQRVAADWNYETQFAEVYRRLCLG